MEHGADINIANGKGITSLIIACKIGDENIVEYLIEHHANVNCIDEKGNSPLIIACYRYCNKTIINALVEHGADINQINTCGLTALAMACYKGNEHLVNYLIERGARINYEIDTNIINSDIYSSKRYYLDWGYKKFYKDDDYCFDEENYVNDFWSPLALACKKNYQNIVKLLVNHGADVNKKGKFYDSPLVIACRNNNFAIVKYLIEYGNAKVDEDEAPLCYACSNGNQDLVYYLVEHGAKVNIKNIDNNNSNNDNDNDNDDDDDDDIYENINKRFGSPLVNACKYGNINIIKYLIEKGADINAKCKMTRFDINEIEKKKSKKIYNESNKNYPLKVAIKYNKKEIIDLLIENVAIVNDKNDHDQEGYSMELLLLSIENNNKKMI